LYQSGNILAKEACQTTAVGFHLAKSRVKNLLLEVARWMRSCYSLATAT